MNFTAEWKEYGYQLGASTMGVADLDRIKGMTVIPANLLAGYTRALVIGIQVSPQIFEQMDTEPTSLYAAQYKLINNILDQCNISLQNQMIDYGFKALAVPASLTVDAVGLRGNLSAKALGIAAGLGWQGKSLLLVNPKYGPRLRIACVLTNAPLLPDNEMANGCGSCKRCKEACPAGAIHGKDWLGRLRTREEAIDIKKCFQRLHTLSQRPEIGANICGVCIKVCPWGKKQNGAS